MGLASRAGWPLRRPPPAHGGSSSRRRTGRRSRATYSSCGSASRRGTTPPRPARTWGGARRSRCGCRASRSCAPRPARLRGTSAPPRTRSPRRSASWGRGHGISRSSVPAMRPGHAAPRTGGTDRFPSKRRSARRPSRASRRRCSSGCRSCRARWRRSRGRPRPPGRATRRSWPDSAGAARQRTLADRADSLARGIERVATDLRAGPRTPLAAPQQAARDARAAMQRAAQAADDARPAAAAAAGTDAERQLARVPEALRGQRDSLAREWRGETLAALDRALSETAALAQGQEGVAEALRRGEAGAATRSRQASVEEGTDAVARQIRDAAGKHALVSPQLDAALGYAKRQMAAARSELEEADPNASEAASLAEDALDALNATALALARSRSQVAGGKSGSGFAEAVEQLARLARDQQGLNGLAQGLLPLMGVSGEAMLQRLRALAARQRALAEQLERLQAGGASAAAGPLAQEAKELARQLEAGRLDQQTIERQQRLYRRLLDAGRTLSNDEPDETKERVSRSATGDSVHIPDVLKPGATGAGPRLRYPTWEELQGLTPEQRRLVLEYFRRLNAPQP